MTGTQLARLAFLLAAWSAAHARAVDFVVTRYDDPTPDGCLPDDCSLREAVIAAQAAIDLDRIVLSAGTYQLTIPGTNEALSADGDLDVTKDLDIVGPGAPMTRIDAAGIGEAAITANANGLDFTLRGVTIQNSDTHGLQLGNGTLTVEDCEIRDNGDASGEHGVVASIGSTLTLRRTTITGSSGNGIMLLQRAAVLENVTISGNGQRELQVGVDTTLSCTHCTIFDPTGVLEEVFIDAVTVQLANSIVAGTCTLLSTGAIDSLGGNVESTGNGCQFDQGTDQFAVPSNELLLGPLADNGGATRTHLPDALSAATGGANDALCLTGDQRGAARASDCESGSVEIASERPATPIFHDGFEQGDQQAWSVP